MSRSQPDLTNPAQHFFQWSGSRGQLEFWDKEKSERVIVPLPFEFLVLDELATITGFSEQDQSGYWSNEVRSTNREELLVKTSKGIKQTGLYKDLTDVRAKGAKYARSIYLAHKNKAGAYMIGNLKASGAALTAWIDLSNKYVVSNGKVRLTGSTEGKKGTTVYQIPTFEYLPAKAEEDQIAIELDKELQVYLNQYLTAPKYTPDELGVAIEDLEDIGKATPEQVAEYETLKKKKSPTADEDLSRIHDANPMNPDPVYNDLDPNEPISLDDIPF